MAKLAKFLQGVAGVGGAGLNVEEVFSTYLYDGSSSAQTITNGIDLSGEGGMVWIKNRGVAVHQIVDTERGSTKYLQTHLTDGEATNTTRLTSFNANGFTLGSNLVVNNSGNNYASWTFRKAPKFFDVVTWTGNGTAGRTISHNLGTTVGCVMIKNLSSAENWMVYHRGSTGTDGIDGQLNLNSTAAATDDSSQFNDTVPSSTVLTLGSNAEVNFNGDNYVAYLFAHNNGDGEFGPSADQDIIKCGSFTTDGSGNATVNLGWEPQFVLWKITNYSADWNIYDSMRGFVVHTSGGKILRPNTTNAELNINQLRPSATGFDGVGVGGGGAAYNVIYMAIRRGPMAVPESATDVFAIDQQNSSEPYLTSGFPVDFAFQKRKDTSSNWMTGSRLQGQRQLNLDLADVEASETAHEWDYMNGFRSSGYSTDWFGWMWRRAPNFFDVVAYTGTGTARTVSHNLGVAPEMIWVKKRNEIGAWPVYHVGAHATSPENYFLQLNSTITATLNSARWNNTAPTATEFTVGTAGTVNDPNDTYIAYLFASLAGISKVGSFSHTNGGGDTNVDCGFSSGARFVVYKQYDSSGGWYVLDSTRGIVAGNDPALLFNSNAAQDSSYDQIDPYSSGFTIPSDGVGTGDYIFYAIA